MKIHIAVCVALVMLNGCAGGGTAPDAPPPRTDSEGRAAKAPPPATSSAASSVVPHYIADPRLDVIRDKVPLTLRGDGVTPAQLGNSRRPNAEEKRAVRSWQELRLAEHQRASAERGPPSQRLQATRILLTQAITQLYAGQLTYGQFAHKVLDIDAQHRGVAPPAGSKQANRESAQPTSPPRNVKPDARAIRQANQTPE